MHRLKKLVDDVIDLLNELDYEKEIKPSKNLMAIVLADETLLKILLESFPLTTTDKKGREFEIADLLNISMGRSHKRS